MGVKKWLDPQRMDIVIAVLIALVSLTASLAAWRTNVVGSSASDANRQGLIDAVKKGAVQSEDWRRVYEEAGFARDFLIMSAAVEAEEASGDKSYQSAAAQQRQYLLPGMQSLSESLNTPGEYLNTDGTFNLDKRFADLEAEDPDLAALDPGVSFKLAEQYSAEQRWLTVGTVLLMVSLFWLGMSELTQDRARTINLVIGICVYLFGVAFIFLIEVLAVIARRGAL